MKNYFEALQFKKICLEYHFNQANEVRHNLSNENKHILISEFCSMMEAINSCIHIARSLAYKQSPVETRAFFDSLDMQMISELKYIEQLVIANRIDNVFTVTDMQISIKQITKKREREYYDERMLISYMLEIKPFSEKMIDEFMNIYYEGSNHYDQSWRIIDVNRAYFSCGVCGEMVTDLLSHIGNLSSISIIEKESYLPRRTYVYGHEVIKAGLLPWVGVNEITADELIIPTDGLYMGTSIAQASGCCGSDSSFLNVTCRNGHPVGGEAADCYMPHFIRLPLNRIKRFEILDG